MRKTIFRWFATYRSTTPSHIWHAYLSEWGCGELSELLQRLADRYGEEAVEAFRSEFARVVATLPSPGPFWTVKNALTKPLHQLNDAFGHYVPECALLALSEAEFLMALDYALEQIRESGFDFNEERPYIEARDFLNRRFETLGVPYRYGSVPGTYDPNETHFDASDSWEPGVVEFHRLLDPQIEETVIEPALRVLTDDRFATTLKEYRRGLSRVVAPNGSQLEDAVLDFGRAVQNALFALVQAVGKTPRGGTAGSLYGQLKNDPLPEESESLVLAASKIRNPVEHPRGRLIDIQHATAEAAMGAASVAITYIASFMPSPPAAGATAGFRAMMDDDIPF